MEHWDFTSAWEFTGISFPAVPTPDPRTQNNMNTVWYQTGQEKPTWDGVHSFWYHPQKNELVTGPEEFHHSELAHAHQIDPPDSDDDDTIQDWDFDAYHPDRFQNYFPGYIEAKGGRPTNVTTYEYPGSDQAKEALLRQLKLESGPVRLPQHEQAPPEEEGFSFA